MWRSLFLKNQLGPSHSVSQTWSYCITSSTVTCTWVTHATCSETVPEETNMPKIQHSRKKCLDISACDHRNYSSLQAIIVLWWTCHRYVSELYVGSHPKSSGLIVLSLSGCLNKWQRTIFFVCDGQINKDGRRTRRNDFMQSAKLFCAHMSSRKWMRPIRCL